MKKVWYRTIVLLVISFSLVSIPASECSLGLEFKTYPQPSSDWIVTGNESYFNRTFLLSGNLTVRAGARLWFDRCVLKINSSTNGKYKVELQAGGELKILNSVFMAGTSGSYYKFLTRGELRVENSTLTDMCGSREFMYRGGLRIYGGNATVVNSNIVKNQYTGITVDKLSPLSMVRIENCTISDNNWDGIYSRASSVIIAKNIISRNKWHGISVENSTPAITNNKIISNSKDGIHCVRAPAQISGNIIGNNGGWGIYASGARPNITATNKFVDESNIPNGLGRVQQVWSLTVHVRDRDLKGVSGASVMIMNRFGTVIQLRRTDELGNLRMETVTEYKIFSDGTTVNFTPHRILTWKMVGAENLSAESSAVIDSNRVIEIVLKRPEPNLLVYVAIPVLLVAIGCIYLGWKLRTRILIKKIERRQKTSKKS